MIIVTNQKDLSLKEFMELSSKPFELNELLKSEDMIKYTLYFASQYGYNLDFLEKGLRILNFEHSCDAGPFDLLGLDINNSIIVIELKTGKATHTTIGQVQAYIMAMKVRNPEKRVRAIVLAKDTTDGYTFSLKASKLRESINFISLLEISSNIYQIYLELGEKKKDFQYMLYESMQKNVDIKSQFPKFIKEGKDGIELLLNVEDLAQILMINKDHLIKWMEKEGYHYELNN